MIIHRTGFDPIPRPLRRPVTRATAPTVSEAVTNSPVAPNPYVGSIPAPVFSEGEFKNLGACVVALKDAVESLSGQRGDIANRAVTFKDLVEYGILSPAALGSANGSLAVATLRPTVIPYNFTPPDPLGTTSPTGVMVGLGIIVTTGLTGSLLIGVTGTMHLLGPVEANIGHVEVRVGTDLDAVPANGGPLSGTTVGTPLGMTELADAALQPFAYTTVSLGLAPLTQVWLDIMQAVSNGTVSLLDLNITVLGV